MVTIVNLESMIKQKIESIELDKMLTQSMLGTW